MRQIGLIRPAPPFPLRLQPELNQAANYHFALSFLTSLSSHPRKRSDPSRAYSCETRVPQKGRTCRHAYRLPWPQVRWRGRQLLRWDELLILRSALVRPTGGWPLREWVDPLAWSPKHLVRQAVQAASGRPLGRPCRLGADHAFSLLAQFAFSQNRASIKASRGEVSSFRPGSNPSHKDSPPMTQADRVLSTPPTNTPIDTTRRRFLTVVAVGRIIGAGSLAAAAMASNDVPRP